jgi:ABC-type multidrug transport system ATPase subunit
MRLEALNLSKRFNREWIFKGFSFTFEPSNIYAITGPNGSGKSTLLSILWGQVPASEGEVRHFNGKRIAADDVYRHVSIATPYMELIDEFTLEEMVGFHFRFKRPIENLTSVEIVKRLDLPTNSDGDKRIASFSSGMKQRLKLGLAFLTESPFLFLDEPSTNLDEKANQWFHRLLSQTGDRVVIMASNQGHEYPQNAIRIDIQSYK